MTKKDLVSLYNHVLKHDTKVKEIAEMWQDFAKSSFQIEDIEIKTPAYVKVCEEFAL